MAWSGTRRRALLLISAAAVMSVVPVTAIAERGSGLAKHASASLPTAPTRGERQPALPSSSSDTRLANDTPRPLASGDAAAERSHKVAISQTSSPTGAPVLAQPVSQAAATVVSSSVGATKRSCVYARHDISKMRVFGALVGHDFDCALVYNNAAPSWKDWEMPWFVVHGDPNFNWAHWATGQHGRLLIISQALIPSRIANDWRQQGAAGHYDAHARALATNLIAAGLANSVIRLAFEANGPWMIDALGPSAQDHIAWRTYWRRFVVAMRSVPGAHFQFDWTVNAGYQPIPFADYYPGDDVVDVIGIDGYDSSVTHTSYATPAERWQGLLHQQAGLADLIAFAHLHNKALSIPEWGLTAPGSPMYGAGDDPTYIDGIAQIVRANAVRYQCYFLSPTGGVGMTLANAPKSLAAYRRHFGLHGDALQ